MKIRLHTASGEVEMEARKIECCTPAGDISLRYDATEEAVRLAVENRLLIIPSASNAVWVMEGL